MRIATSLVSLFIASAAYASTPETVTLDVQNMTCAACPITVKKALEKVPGVSDIKVDFQHKTVTMRAQLNRADATLLTKATADAGFPSTIRK
jgi:mercuric ion binding protein